MKLSRKFMLGISLILLFTLTLSIFINTKIVEKYYLKQQSSYVHDVGTKLTEALEHGIRPEDAVSALEAAEKVLIVYSDQTSDLESLSMELRDEFRQKGLGYEKYWLWDQDYISAAEKGYQFRFYQQDRLNYGILVEYIPIESRLFAVAAIVPDAADFVAIINHFGILLYSFSLLVAMVLIYFLVRYITRPLQKIETYTQQISRQEYGTLTVKTGDELEAAAESMNQMGISIRQYQEKLLDKNRQMEQMLDNVAHDLKTPISLVGMYASGMRDGLDDGTFLDTILQQNSSMARLADRLLHLSGIGRKDPTLSLLSLDEHLRSCMDEQELLFRERGLCIDTSIVSQAEIRGYAPSISAIFSNLLSNAAKYASGGTVEISLGKEENRYRFTISNQFQNPGLDTDRIWEPFYVGETSRNQALSGTGLGLAIVYKTATQAGYTISCIKEGNVIRFIVIFQ